MCFSVAGPRCPARGELRAGGPDPFEALPGFEVARPGAPGELPGPGQLLTLGEPLPHLRGVRVGAGLPGGDGGRQLGGYQGPGAQQLHRVAVGVGGVAVRADVGAQGDEPPPAQVTAQPPGRRVLDEPPERGVQTGAVG